MAMAMSAGGNNHGPAKKPNRGKVVNDINVTPLVDVMLVMLIIFMVVTPMLQKGVSVDLAKSRNYREMKEADKDDAILIAVNRDGRYFLGGDPIGKEKVQEKVKDLLQAKTGDRTVYVKSDRRAKYFDVAAIVDEIRGAGVDALGLVTDKLEEKRAVATTTPSSE